MVLMIMRMLNYYSLFFYPHDSHFKGKDKLLHPYYNLNLNAKLCYM
jgi:hypothetical protein